MSTDLQISLIVGIWTLTVAFWAYWSGVARAEARARAEREFLLDEIDEAVRLISNAQQAPLYLVGGTA